MISPSPVLPLDVAYHFQVDSGYSTHLLQVANFLDFGYPLIQVELAHDQILMGTLQEFPRLGEGLE